MPNAGSAPSVALNVPTVAVTVTQVLPLSLSSAAEYRLYNGGRTISMDSSGALTVNGPTEIRFVVQGADGSAYTPIGIRFKERPNDANVGQRDPFGHVAFPMRTLVANRNTMQLSVFDANPARAEFEFDLTFQGSDGALGFVDPPIHNNGGNM